MKYPRIGSYQKPKPNSQRACVNCHRSPAGLLDIQVNEFRGDDITYSCCKEHACKSNLLSKVSTKREGI